MTDEIFEWVEPETEKHVFFNASKLYEVGVACILNDIVNIYLVEWRNILMDREFVSKFPEMRGIDVEKAKNLPEYVLKIPSVALEMDDGSVLMVDGHHRIYHLYLENKESYPVLFFPLGQWEWSIVEFPEEFKAI